MGRLGILAACAAAGLIGATAPALAAEAVRGGARTAAPAPQAEVRQQPARGGTAGAERGKASYTAPRLAGRRMADGGRFDPRSDAAAHRTLPLGSAARVTNLGNGRSATVTVRDRGPRAPGRILDVSPRTAEQLGMREGGVAEVEVAPIGASPSGGGAEPSSGTTSGGGPGRTPG
jgi:rare lipoprotein A